MPPQLRVSVLVVGDEILGGFVQDTNSGWIARRLQHLGVPLDRVVTVPDDVPEITDALGAELARVRPRLVLTSGGVGSTPDDVTMAAVAAHLDVPLVVHPTLDARISRALAAAAAGGVSISAEHERSMRRMALVPAGAYLLPHPGLAGGVAVDLDGGAGRDTGATVVVLPGVPSELRRIVSESVEPQLLAGRGAPAHVAEIAHPFPESALNPLLERLVSQYPDVHVGSYPGRECLVRLKGPREQVDAAKALVDAELRRLAALPGSEEMRQGWRSRWA